MNKNKLKFFLLASAACLLLLAGCDNQPEKKGHFSGEKRDPQEMGPVLSFHELTNRDTFKLGDSVVMIYNFTNTGFQTAKITGIENMAPFCEATGIDSVQGGKTGRIVARCRYDEPGFYKGSFKVMHNTAQNPIVLTYRVTVIK